MARHACLTLIIVAIFTSGCQSPSSGDRGDRISNDPGSVDKPAAYINAAPTTQADLYAVLVELGGGEALSELILNRAIEERLAAQGLSLDDAAESRERERLLDSLASDPDEAAKLLKTLRERRGLGDLRFGLLLKRNAGLRLLVRSDIAVGESAVQQAYALRFGERYRVRVITSSSVPELSAVRRRVLEGASFTDQAIAVSADASAAQGGLLSPISPADATYPKAFREALGGLSRTDPASRLSPIVAMPEGYALLWLEEILPAQGPPIAEVRGELEQGVRLELERVRMQQLARVLIEDANIIVLDPALDKAWQRHRESIVDR